VFQIVGQWPSTSSIAVQSHTPPGRRRGLFRAWECIQPYVSGTEIFFFFFFFPKGRPQFAQPFEVVLGWQQVASFVDQCVAF